MHMENQLPIIFFQSFKNIYSDNVNYLLYVTLHVVIGDLVRFSCSFNHINCAFTFHLRYGSISWLQKTRPAVQIVGYFILSPTRQCSWTSKLIVHLLDGLVSFLSLSCGSLLCPCLVPFGVVYYNWQHALHLPQRVCLIRAVLCAAGAS